MAPRVVGSSPVIALIVDKGHGPDASPFRTRHAPIDPFDPRPGREWAAQSDTVAAEIGVAYKQHRAAQIREAMTTRELENRRTSQKALIGSNAPKTRDFTNQRVHRSGQRDQTIDST